MPVKNYIPFTTADDVTQTRTLLHEVLPLTGTIVSGTYGGFRTERNIKNYSHGMFQSVYDYAYLSSSANHIFDITLGYDKTSILSGTTGTIPQQKKKINMYNQFAQLLLGYTGSTTDGIRKFESDLTLDGVGYLKQAFVISFSRLLTKDQIKKGSFSIALGTGSWASPFMNGATSAVRTLADVSASVSTTGVQVCDGGEYGLLYDSKENNLVKGLIFYQAGIAVISSSVWAQDSRRGGHTAPGVIWSGSTTQFNQPHHSAPSVFQDVTASMASSSISSSTDALRHRIQNISYNNTTEINSKIYFCRVPFNAFNYSSNPTYTSGSKIVVKSTTTDMPVSYVTTVGLYNDGGELLAVAKLSEPLRKDPTNDMTIRVRLDY